jgi:hypothetical protein
MTNLNQNRAAFFSHSHLWFPRRNVGRAAPGKPGAKSVHSGANCGKHFPNTVSPFGQYDLFTKLKSNNHHGVENGSTFN